MRRRDWLVRVGEGAAVVALFAGIALILLGGVP